MASLPLVSVSRGSLWAEAVQNLALQDRATLQNPEIGRTDVLEAILQVIEIKKKLCLDKRWTFVKGGKVIVLRDKLDKIVTWVQRFKEVGSTIVQYDPVHAALPWAGVLFILQCAMGDAQTFGAMVDGVEAASSLIARYSAFDFLDSPTRATTPIEHQLRTAILKLDIAILRYLANAARFFSTNTARRALASTVSSTESQVTQYLDIISKKANAVDSCLLSYQAEKSHATDQRTLTILKCLSALQGPVIRTTAEVSELYRELKGQDRKRITNWLSTVNSLSHHRSEGRDYLPDSGAWLLRRPEFLGWRHASTSATLWLHGIPGCGKTKLVYKTIQECLEAHGSITDPAPFAFFYCARNPAEPERSSPTDIMKSILKQLSIDGRGRIKDPVVKAFRSRQRESEIYGEAIEPLTIFEAQALILEILEKDPAVIIIDALDECDPVSRHQLIAAFDAILKQSQNVVKVMLASRDDGDIRAHFAQSSNIYIRADDNEEDLDRFVHYSLLQAESSRRILHGNVPPALRAEILASLKRGARGMFRWVTLQIEALCNIERIKIATDVREELGRPPQTLKESYSRTYDKIRRLARPSYIIADRVFKWLLSARRLLNLRDLAAAVTFASERHEFSADNILDICCNMVVVDDHGFFRFAHLSVREYLEGHESYSSEKCNTFVLQRCLEAYTNITTGYQSWSHNSVDLDLKAYSMLYWPTHLQHAVSTTQNQPVRTMSEEFIFEYGQTDQAGRTLLAQSFRDWLDDIWNTSQYADIADTEHTTVEFLESTASQSHTPQFLACLLDTVWLLDRLDAHGWSDWNIKNNRQETCVQIATARGNTRTLHWLLEKATPSKEVLTEACHQNIKARRTNIVKILIRHGVEFSSALPGKDCLLYEAVSEDLYEVVSRMLEDAEQLDVHGFTRSMCLAYGRSREQLFPLFWAACRRLPAPTYLRALLIVQSLVGTEQGPAEFEDIGELIQILVRFAETADNSQVEHVYRLTRLLRERFEYLEVLPDGTIVVVGCPNSQFGETLPVWALVEHPTESCNSTCEALEILIRLGGCDVGRPSNTNLDKVPIDCDGGALGSDASTGLYVICSSFHGKGSPATQLASILLDNGADLSFTDDKGRTALIMAAKHEHNDDLIHHLVKHGVSLQAADKKGQTALCHAIKRGHEDTVKALLSWVPKIDIEQVAGGTTPLQDAVASCEHRIIKLLRQHGAERISSTTDKHGFLLPWLPLIGCQRCVAYLMGDSTNEQDGRSGICAVFNDLAKVYEDDEDEDPFSNPEQFSLSNLKTAIVPNMRSWEDGLTVLQAAISLGDEGLIDYLLDIPVDVNAVDNHGFTALHYAVLSSRAYWSTECLLQRGADPCLRDGQGRIPLHLSLLSKHWDKLCLVECLLAASKAPLNTQDVNGNTVVHMAILLNSRKDVMRCILEAGPDLTLQNNNNQTPIELAIMCGYFPTLWSLDYTLDVFSDAHKILYDPAEAEQGQSLLQDESLVANDDEDDAADEEHEGSELAEWPGRVPAEKILLVPVMPTEYAAASDVDLYTGYGTETWSALSGETMHALRPLDANYREQGHARLGL